MRTSQICTSFEDEAWAAGYRWIAGLDEVGRGCLAGPVVAAAVIIDRKQAIPDGLDDSKKLTRQQRERIGEELRSTAICYAVGEVEAEEIDRINILQATFKAMMNALASLSQDADFLLVDALHLKQCSLPQKAIIHGDAISASIAAASVIAKTHRDALMRDQHNVYPEYGFASHVGYGTRSHLDALRTHGPCPLHRRSFHGVLPGQQDLFDDKDSTESLDVRAFGA